MPESRSVHVPIIVFGFDYDEEHRSAGLGTCLRCAEGVRLYKLLKNSQSHPILIVSPGRSPDVSAKVQPKTMAEMMQEVLINMGVSSHDIFVASSPTTWGTRNELIAAVQQLRRLERQGYQFCYAYLVSNRLHLKRVRVLARALKRNLALPWQWRSSYCRTFVSSWNTKERVKEWAKFGVELMRARRWHPQI